MTKAPWDQDYQDYPPWKREKDQIDLEVQRHKKEEFFRIAEEARRKKEFQEQFIQIIKQQMNKQPKFDMLFEDDLEFKRKGPQGQVINKIPPPPDTFCVYFLGGPRNGTQEFLLRKENNFIQDGKIGQFMDEIGPVELDEHGKIKNKPISCYEYQFDFLQLSRSKWLPEHQVVLAVFIS